MLAPRPIVFCYQAFDEYLGTHARKTALSAVDFLATRKFRQHLLAHFGYLAQDSSALGRRDIHLIAPRFVHNIKASTDISAGCHGLDADRRCHSCFLGKLEATKRTILGMTLLCVLAVSKELDLLGSCNQSESDRTSAQLSPWTAVRKGRRSRLATFLVNLS
jgi:hypothetical protein